MSDLEAIQHLDFDLDEGVKCDGSREILEDGTTLHDRSNCPNKAAYEAFRACCGTVENLCKDCYNWHCSGHKSDRTDCRYCHESMLFPMFSDVYPLT